MDIPEYQRRAKTTDRIPPAATGLEFIVFALQEELGGLSQLFKKRIRDGGTFDAYREDVASKIGHLVWYLTILCERLGLSLEDVLVENLAFAKGRWYEVTTEPQ